MTKIFYDHLVIIEEIVTVLDTHALDAAEKLKLMSLVDETMHHSILDTILTLLPKEHHEEFFIQFHANPGNHTLMSFLKEKTNRDVEKAILKRASEVKKQILKEIEQSKTP